MWHYWEHLRCVAQSALFIAVIIYLSKFCERVLSEYIVFRYIFFTKHFSVNWKKWLSMSSIQALCRVRNIPCEEQINSFCWSLTEWFTFVNRWKTQVNMFLEICIVQHVQKENVHLLFWRKLSANHNQAYTSSLHKRQKNLHIWHNRVDFLFVATVIRKFRSSLNLYSFNLQSAKMTFSVSNNAIEWSPDFGPDSIILTVINTCAGNDNRFTRNLYWQPGACYCLADESFWTTTGL